MAEAAGGAPLSPVFETRVKRVVERLAAPSGGEVELALDEGEIRAGEARAPIREAEIELKAGDVGAVYAPGADAVRPRAGALLGAQQGGARLPAGAAARPSRRSAPRNAAHARRRSEATVETVARDVLRDCLGQIADNMVVVAESEEDEGPHQLRIGLRRLRTALTVFGPSLGEAAVAPLNAAARDLGRLVGRLRDADVLIAEVVEPAAALGLEPAARAALVAALEARRQRVRAEVRAGARRRRRRSASCSTSGCSSRAGAGWRRPTTARPSGWRRRSPEVAPAMLDKRHRRVRKAGKHVRSLDAEGLHELRKELKKLRYAVDMLGPLYPGRRSRPYLKALKELQDSFGSLNDAAMAEASLTGAGRPGAGRPGGAARHRLGARHAGGEGRRRPAAALRPLGAAARGGAVLGVKRARVPASDNRSTIVRCRLASNRTATFVNAQP